MYDRITPDESAYPLDAPEAEWMEWQDRAATRMLHEHSDNLCGADVEVTISEDIMSLLHIEGHPYPEVMATVDCTGCVYEAQLQQVLHLRTLYSRGVPADGKLHPCLDELMAPVVDCYIDMADTPENRKRFNVDILNHAEMLLKTCHDIPSERHVLVGVFDSRDDHAAARKAAVGLNRRFAPDSAFAVREGDRVEVSVHTLSPQQQSAVKAVLNTSPDCLGVELQPWRNLKIQHTAYVMCGNGQLLGGYVDVEGIEGTHRYGIEERSTGRARMVLTPDYDASRHGRLFVTDELVRRFMASFHGQFMPVAYLMRVPEFQNW